MYSCLVTVDTVSTISDRLLFNVFYRVTRQTNNTVHELLFTNTYQHTVGTILHSHEEIDYMSKKSKGKSKEKMPSKMPMKGKM